MSQPPEADRKFGCVKCGGKTAVHESRPARVPGKDAIMRRRRCLICGHRFKTYEMTMEAYVANSRMRAKIARTFTEFQSILLNQEEVG